MLEHDDEDVKDVSQIEDDVQVIGHEKESVGVQEEKDDGDPDYSKEELDKAVAEGYNPDKGKLSPGEFNRRGELFTKIKDLKTQNTREKNQLQKSIDALTEKMTASEQRGYQRALHEIQTKRMAAVDIGDRSEFEKYDKEFQELQKQASASASPVQDQELSAFETRNSGWFNYDTAENSVMRDEAFAFQQRFLSDRADKGLPALSRSTVGNKIEEYIKLKYPHRFENPAKEKPPAVEGSQGSRIGKEVKVGLRDLSPTQQEACKQYMKDHGKTVDDYIAILAKAGITFK